MSRASSIVDALKSYLRQRHKTYADVARGLGIAESSVKRLFAQKNFTLKRLESICDFVGVDVADLLEAAKSSDTQLKELSEEQESALVGDAKLLLTGILVINHWSVEDILSTYKFTEPELIRLLTKLDRLKVIDLMPGNRYRVRLTRHFSWRKEGPIQQFFEDQVQYKFFESSFRDPDELRLFVHGSLSQRSNAIIQQRLRKVAEEFDALVEEDKNLTNDMREGSALLLAMRPWELGLFTAMRRDPSTSAKKLRSNTTVATPRTVRKVRLSDRR